MSKLRVVFLGTPEFAVTCLESMVKDKHYEIVGVVTQPDRPAGRKMQLTPTAVKTFCLKKNIPVISPENLKDEETLRGIHAWSAEVAVVVAFGQLLTEKFMNLFPLGAVNVHGSLLPRWRGAAPIQRAIETGDLETGVALQKMVKKLDAGDILGIRKIPITQDVNAQELHDKLACLGGELLNVELMDYARGNLTAISQNEELVTYAKKIEKSEGEIHWKKSAQEIHNQIRAFVMGPGSFTFFTHSTSDANSSSNGRIKVKIHKTQILSEDRVLMNPIMQVAVNNPMPGVVMFAEGGECWVSTGRGFLKILEIQPESRNRMKIEDFIKGYGLKSGDQFGEKNIGEKNNA
jgi:methionyl-tRNA formyltransferase